LRWIKARELAADISGSSALLKHRFAMPMSDYGRNDTPSNFSAFRQIRESRPNREWL
jgi:hypothetical protein